MSVQIFSFKDSLSKIYLFFFCQPLYRRIPLPKESKRTMNRQVRPNIIKIIQIIKFRLMDPFYTIFANFYLQPKDWLEVEKVGDKTSRGSSCRNIDRQCLQMGNLVYIISQISEMNFSSSESEDDRPPAMEGIGFASLQNSEGTNSLDSGKTPSTTPLFLGKYEDLGKIGEGANGSVHLYQKLKNKKKYAVKIMSINEESEKNIRKNYLQVLTLRTCPNLVKYRGMYSDLKNGICHLIMNYYDFPKLDTRIRYPEEELKTIVEQILEGLVALHSKEFYHRDIKPENILYDRGNKKIVIVDLGVGRKFKKGQLGTVAVGSAAYRAPEAGKGKGDYDHRMDIYSLGITIFELVTGKFPPKKLTGMASNTLKQHELPAFDEPEWKEYSNQLRSLVEKMICYEPEQRFDASQCLTHPWFIRTISPDCQKQKVNPEQDIRLPKTVVEKKKVPAGNSEYVAKKSPKQKSPISYEIQQIDSPAPLGSDEEF